MVWILRAVALGGVAGFMGGLFGIGGGLVMVPVMVLFMGIPQHRAHANSIATVVLSASAAVVPLALGDKVHWDAAGMLAAGSVVGAYFGARLLGRISAVWLARGFVVLTVVVAVRMSLQGGGSEGESLAAAVDLLSGLSLCAIGLLAGALASLAIGGGVLFVAALAVLFTFPQHEAQATALAVTVPTCLVATLVHARAGLVDWRMVAQLGSGGVLGGLVGGRVALGLGEVLLRRMFAGFLVLMALRMLWTTTRRGDTRRAPIGPRAARRPMGGGSEGLSGWSDEGQGTDG